MKTVSIIIFDNFTDLDLFLLWDILGRSKQDFDVKILGTKAKHLSTNGLLIEIHESLEYANRSDIALFTSGKGTRAIIHDQSFLQAFKLNPNTQIIGSVCSGALILATLGFLKNMKATTHPRAREQLIAMNIDVVDLPFVSAGNIATAGGCLAAQYLAGWVINKIYGEEKRQQILNEIFPVGQQEMFEKIVSSSIHNGIITATETMLA